MKKNIIPALFLFALLAACDRGSSASSGTLPALAPVVTPKAEINYRADLVPLLVGSYTGSCTKPPSVAPVVATTLVTADGAVKSTGISGNLLDKDAGLQFSKTFDSSGVQSFLFSGIIGDDTFGLILKSGDGDAVHGDVQSYNGASSVVCTDSPEIAKLTTKSIFSPIEKYFTAPARDISCMVNGSSVETVRYQVLDGGVKLGGETYSFATGLKSEGLLIGPVLGAAGELNYLVEMLDGRSVTLMLDKFGALLLVSAKSGTGAVYNCTSP